MGTSVHNTGLKVTGECKSWSHLTCGEADILDSRAGHGWKVDPHLRSSRRRPQSRHRIAAKCPCDCLAVHPANALAMLTAALRSLRAMVV